MNNILIRQYSQDDRQSVREISFETSFMEQPDKFIDDREIIADALTVYFTDYEPESCFVSVSKGQVIGYLIGTTDGRRLNHIFLMKILPGLILRCLSKGLLFKKKEQQLAKHFLISFLKGEFFVPNCLKQYPALFHINIDKIYRGQNVGHQLIDRFIKLLMEKNIVGVHVSTMSEKAKEFFMRMGFKTQHLSNRSYLKYRLGHKFPFYIMGKSLG